jgi:protein-disulfide isomerase
VNTGTLAIVAMLSLGASTCRGQTPAGGAGTEGSAASSGAGNGASSGSGAIVELPGVDTSALTPREKREFSSYVTELLSPCADVAVPLAQCILEKRACPRCLPAAKFVQKAVRDGYSREQVETSYKNRFSSDRVKNVAIDGSPVKGPESAVVTMVEFADFECPFCAQVAPMLDKVVAERNGQVRVVYKFMPLPSHPHGEIAARAAIAAMAQGKFWEMHKKLFENQKHLELPDLEGYAKDLKLDVAKFRADMNAPSTTERLEKDRKLADALAVKGTPTVFVNGREFDVRTDLGEWIDAEVAMVKEHAGK